jgi:hypothetical protein
MAQVGIGFQLSANAQQMSAGINAGVVELQKLGYAAKKTASDVAVLRNIEIGRAFISAVQSVANTFTQFTSGAASAVDSTLKLSRSLGISYQELRQLQLAADLSGASSEQLAGAFTRAQLTIAKAGQGSKEAVADLRVLGLTVDDLAGKSVSQQFSELAAAITRIQDPAQRAAAAVAIFGKSGAQLLPVFQGLPESLKQAQGFLDQFKGGLAEVDAARIEQLNDSFTLAGQAVQELAGQLLAKLQPSLQRGAEQFVAFISQIDISAAAAATATALSDVASVLGVLSQFAAPLAKNLLPAIGGYLAFINRQAIATALTQLAQAFGAAAFAALGYSSAAKQAATASAVLATSIRGLLASTGIGAVVVAIGLAAGAIIDWGLGGAAAGQQVEAAADDGAAALRRAAEEANVAARAAVNFGEEVARAIKVPQEITINEFAQGSLDEARSAIVSLGRELGGLNQVPRGVLQAFAELSVYAGKIDGQVQNQAVALQAVDDESRKIITTIQQITDARKRDADATRQAAEDARRATQEASRDARKRVQDLVQSGLPDTERSRLQLSEDLLAINRTIADAEKQVADARKAGDLFAVLQAEERLRLTKETGAAAAKAARQQERERNLAARGIDQSLLQPAKTLLDQVTAVRQAFQAREITGDEARNALRNLAAEGIEIRRDIAAELARPAQQALQVADVRTQDGASQFLAMAAGRNDPAIEQRRSQLAKLDEIKRVLEANGVRAADILGAA